jgi:hypothetical protein
VQNTEPLLPVALLTWRLPAHVLLEQILLLAKPTLLAYPLQGPQRLLVQELQAPPTFRAPAKIFGPAKPLWLRVGDRQPVRQTPVVPQRRGLGLVVNLALHRLLTSY